MTPMTRSEFSLPMGIYRHYKGELYQVIALGHDANHNDDVVVIYMPLQLNAAHLGPRMAVRTLTDFKAIVHVQFARDNWPVCPGVQTCSLARRTEDGSHLDVVHWEENHRSRFSWLGPVLTAEMMAVDIGLTT